jgi:EAL domain-containing protein (putative c-di-GMP-specific phosphodiesterase class I)
MTDKVKNLAARLATAPIVPPRRQRTRKPRFAVGTGPQRSMGRDVHRADTARLDYADRMTELETQFESALTSLNCAFQPIVVTTTGHVTGYEALVRSGEDTLPTPERLFAAAEALNRVGKLGRPFRRIAAQRFVAKQPEPRSLFVNVHAWELMDRELFARFMPLGRIAHRVVLELTDQQHIDAVPEVADRVSDLRDLGYRVAIDNFGAGGTRMKRLTLDNADYVKLAMSVVSNVDIDPIARDLAASLIEACHDNGVYVIATGVETNGQWRALTDLECDFVQGNHIAAPTPWFREPTGGMRLPLTAADKS